MRLGNTSKLPAKASESLVFRLTAPRRLLLILSIIVCVAFSAQLRALIQHEGAFYKGGNVPIGSDFNAFYSAGRIVASGEGSQLYDLSRQQIEQLRVLKSEDFDGFQPFAYPAFVAAPYALLAQVPFFWSSLITTALMIAATLGVVVNLRSVSPTVRQQPLIFALALFASQPLTAAIFGGQTVAVSLLCFSGCYSSLRRGREVTAGLWLGLLFYKPQLAVPLLLLLLWRGRFRTVVVALAIATALVLLGAVVAGPSWPRAFLDLSGGDFYAIEADRNGPNMISFLGVAEQALGPKGESSYLIAGALSFAVFFVLARTWRSATTDGQLFPLQFGLAISATLMVSPHALFYETGLLIVPITALIDTWTSNPRNVTPRQRWFVIATFAAGFLWLLGPMIGFQLLAVVPVAVGLAALKTIKELQHSAIPRAEILNEAGFRWGESPIAHSGKRS